MRGLPTDPTDPTDPTKPTKNSSKILKKGNISLPLLINAEFMEHQIIASNNNYEELLCYKKAQVIYDLTYHFCTRFIDKYDRTFDQMIQAARSGKQNIVEGIIDSSSSIEMAIKLINVARGSHKELLEDFKDYLRTRNMKQWEYGSREVAAMRKIGTEHTDSEYYIRLAESRTDDVIANMTIVLLHQEDKLILGYLRHIEERFKSEGGIKERMYHVRKAVQNRG